MNSANSLVNLAIPDMAEVVADKLAEAEAAAQVPNKHTARSNARRARLIRLSMAKSVFQGFFPPKHVGI